jgi:hypothetical protein
MRRLLVALVASLALTAAACGGGDGPDDPGGGSTEAARPSSPATIAIKAPKNGAVVKAGDLDLKLGLEGGEVVDPSEREVTPTTGHIHVELDGVVVSMRYGLEQTIEVAEPGTHTLRVEFVAADHRPFDPRVFADVAFTAR